MLAATVAAAVFVVLRLGAEVVTRTVTDVWADFGLPRGWVHLFAVAAVATACLVAARTGRPERRLPVDHAMAAGALALPLIVLGQAVLVISPWPWSEPGRVQATLECCGGKGFLLVPLIIFLFGLTTAGVVLAHGPGRPAPTLTTSVLLMLLSASAATVVLVPDLVPAWADVCCEPGPSPAPGPTVWIPVLLVPVAVNSAVVVAASRRR